jgi:hypothetical protein
MQNILGDKGKGNEDNDKSIDEMMKGMSKGESKVSGDN